MSQCALPRQSVITSTTALPQPGNWRYFEFDFPRGSDALIHRGGNVEDKMHILDAAIVMRHANGEFGRNLQLAKSTEPFSAIRVCSPLIWYPISLTSMIRWWKVGGS